MNERAVDLNSYEGFDQEFHLDTLEDSRTYLVVDSNGTHIRLTPSAYALLAAVKSGMPFDRLAKVLNSRFNNRQAVSAKRLSKSYEDLLRKLQAIEKSGAEKQRLPWGFWARLRFLPQPMVRRFASHLTFLYTARLAVIFALAITASLLYCWDSAIRVAFSGPALAYSYGLFLLSLLAHEFGHAAASQRFGAEPSDIGFAIYLIYPALYSDVTSAWRLSRWRRVVVDIGGCYFQLIVGCVFLITFRVTGWQPLWVASLMILYTCIFSLNPIFKFDGYWIAADILGVTNLGKQPSRLAKHFWELIRKRPTRPLPWSRPVINVLIVYSVASCAVWALFVSKIVPLLGASIVRFGRQIESLHQHISQGAGTTWPEARAILGSTYVLAILGISAWQLSKRTVKYIYGKVVPGHSSAQKQSHAGVTTVQPPVYPDSMNGARNIPLVSQLSDGE